MKPALELHLQQQSRPLLSPVDDRRQSASTAAVWRSTEPFRASAKSERITPAFTIAVLALGPPQDSLALSLHTPSECQTSKARGKTPRFKTHLALASASKDRVHENTAASRTLPVLQQCGQ